MPIFEGRLEGEVERNHRESPVKVYQLLSGRKSIKEGFAEAPSRTEQPSRTKQEARNEMTDPFGTVLKTCVPRLGRFATSHLLRAVLWCELQGGCRETAWAPGQC